MPQDTYQALQRTVKAVVAAYSSPSPWNADQIWATRTEDCLHYIHPKEAIPEAFRAPIDKKQHIRTLKSLAPLIENFELEIQDAVIDVHTKTVVARLAARYDLRDVGDDEPRRGLTTEFMWLMEMDEGGERVRRVEEFLDQASFLSGLTERAAKYAKSQG